MSDTHGDGEMGRNLGETGEDAGLPDASTAQDGEDCVNPALPTDSLRRAAYVFLTALVADLPLAILLSDPAREAALEVSKLLWRIGEENSPGTGRELASEFFRVGLAHSEASSLPVLCADEARWGL